jgi:hypothetical protein
VGKPDSIRPSAKPSHSRDDNHKIKLKSNG